MMMKGRTIFSIMGMVAALVATMLSVHSCGIYSFTGTSIQPEVKTVTINYFEYQALKVNPSLSNDLTNALQDKFLKVNVMQKKMRIVEAWIDDPNVYKGAGPQSRKELYGN